MTFKGKITNYLYQWVFSSLLTYLAILSYLVNLGWKFVDQNVWWALRTHKFSQESTNLRENCNPYSEISFQYRLFLYDLIHTYLTLKSSMVLESVYGGEPGGRVWQLPYQYLMYILGPATPIFLPFRHPCKMTCTDFF